MQRHGAAVLATMCILFLSAADGSVENLPQASGCAEGWIKEEVTLYTKDTLFDRINGEAELYFPYGFEGLVSVRYASRDTPGLAVEADVYEMGSPLDAFGIYASYRRADDVGVSIGAEGTISSSQLLFYQDRYFVRLQASGTARLDPDVFLACGRAVARNLPRSAGLPSELDALMIPAAVRGSERYVAQSLLGYRFFRRGLIADATLEGDSVQIFLVPEDSRDTARAAFHEYRSYLQTSGQGLQVSEDSDRISLAAVDPLYGNVVVAQWGRCLIGTVKGKDAAAARELIEQVRKRIVAGLGG